MLTDSEFDLARIALNSLQRRIYEENVKAGWYKDPKTGRRIIRNLPEMIALIHSELSEALEGLRKKLQDTHLPRPMVMVEMADVLVRVFDICGYMQDQAAQGQLGYITSGPPRSSDVTGDWRLGDIFCEKVIYNSTRSDHKLENRAKEGGKAF